MRRTLFAKFFPFLFVFSIWIVCSLILGSDRLPGPIKVGRTLVDSFRSDPIIAAQGGGPLGYSFHVEMTVVNAISGILAGGFIGVCGAVIVARNALVRAAIAPILNALRFVPPLLFIPFVILLVPLPLLVQPVSTAVYASTSLFLFTLEATDGVPSRYVDQGQLLGASRWRTLWTIDAPAMLPALIAGLRVTIATSIGVAVVAEYLAAPFGIGRVIKFAMSFSRLDLIIVGIVWATLFSVTLDVLLRRVSRYLLRWTERSTKQPG